MNLSLRRVIIGSSWWWNLTQVTHQPTLAFTEEEKLAIQDRQQVETRAEVIATAQPTNAQIIRELASEQPEDLLQRSCDTANIPLI